MRAHTLAGMIGIAVVAGCHETTAPPSPDRPRTAPINLIEVTARAARTDTIFIRFSYITAPCDSSAIGVRQTLGSVRLTATAYPTQQPCIAVPSVESFFRYVVLPQHTVPFTVVFTQPSGNDSVRVVPAQLAAQ